MSSFWKQQLLVLNLGTLKLKLIILWLVLPNSSPTVVVFEKFVCKVNHFMDAVFYLLPVTSNMSSSAKKSISRVFSSQLLFTWKELLTNLRNRMLSADVRLVFLSTQQLMSPKKIQFVQSTSSIFNYSYLSRWIILWGSICMIITLQIGWPLLGPLPWIWDCL